MLQHLLLVKYNHALFEVKLKLGGSELLQWPASAVTTPSAVSLQLLHVSGASQQVEVSQTPQS